MWVRVSITRIIQSFTSLATLMYKKRNSRYQVSCLHYWYRRVNQLNKTDCHDVTEILLKVALNTITNRNDNLKHELLIRSRADTAKLIVVCPLVLFYFVHYIVCSSLIYRFWLPLWYLQTLLMNLDYKMKYITNLGIRRVWRYQRGNQNL
jgi:hypothetical protein